MSAKPEMIGGMCAGAAGARDGAAVPVHPDGRLTGVKSCQPRMARLVPPDVW